MEKNISRLSEGIRLDKSFGEKVVAILRLLCDAVAESTAEVDYLDLLVNVPNPKVSVKGKRKGKGKGKGKGNVSSADLRLSFLVESYNLSPVGQIIKHMLPVAFDRRLLATKNVNLSDPAQVGNAAQVGICLLDYLDDKSLFPDESYRDLYGQVFSWVIKSSNSVAFRLLLDRPKANLGFYPPLVGPINSGCPNTLLLRAVNFLCSTEEGSDFCQGAKEIVTLLLRKDLDIDLIEPTLNGPVSALYCAVNKGRADVVRMLLAAGADPNLKIPVNREYNIIASDGTSKVCALKDMGIDTEWLEDVLLMDIAESSEISDLLQEYGGITAGDTIFPTPDYVFSKIDQAVLASRKLARSHDEAGDNFSSVCQVFLSSEEYSSFVVMKAFFSYLIRLFQLRDGQHKFAPYNTPIFLRILTCPYFSEAQIMAALQLCLDVLAKKGALFPLSYSYPDLEQFGESRGLTLSEIIEKHEHASSIFTMIKVHNKSLQSVLRPGIALVAKEGDEEEGEEEEKPSSLGSSLSP